MKNKIPMLISIISILQVVIVSVFAIYYWYIMEHWGYNERFFLDIISDSAYLLLIVVSIGLLWKKPWGWWLGMIVYFKLAFAGVLSIVFAIVNILSGNILEPLNFQFFLYDFLAVSIFVIVVGILSLPSIRNFYSVSYPKGVLFFFVGIGGIILYVLYFIIMLVSINAFL
ncbi:hypothetical protein [Evansella tamaricis]|uniref:Uncharacterized protein n=1 Tax=Evansella tamaricis TaxID=2069301 RepID=A0ABS6JCK6_9BACI|nr:hypothetical protein [Evansella tamaricis]MBU9711406.1 hypothetical protein [Evansella tamaricis]